jgi:hypothetical protein
MPKLDATTAALFAQGTEVGEMAHQLFPGGVAVEGEYWDVQGVLRSTAQLMANSSVPAIFEAAFVHDDVLVRVDVLQRRAQGRWRLVEVKSSNGMKEEYLPDVAIQKYVAEGAGVLLETCELMHLNKNYALFRLAKSPPSL